MGMYKNFTDILNVLYNDETLLRLLYYPAANLKGNIPDPLDISLPNILDIDTEWTIRHEYIMKTAKTDDLTSDTPICRLFVYAGRRIPTNRNYAMSDQNIFFDILVHNSFEEGDLRLEKIADRLNNLFVSEKVTGIGKMEYVNGTPIGSPSGYVGFKHIFKITEFKK